MLSNVKSVILDIADNHGGPSDIRLRSVELFLGGSLIDVSSTNAVFYNTTANGDYTSENVFDSSLSKTGPITGNEWISSTDSTTNQRLICVFNTLTSFDKIVINNGHSEGTLTTRGVNNITIISTTEEVTDVTYGAEVVTPTILFDGIIPEHIGEDVVDDFEAYLYIDQITVVFNNPYPTGSVKKYGLQQTLGISTTISGSSSCINELTFYLSSSEQIGATISGITCLEDYNVTLDTISGVEYNWYASTIVSGTTYTSDMHSFYVRYLCSGICETNGIGISGVEIKIHRRNNGSLVGNTTSAGTGLFSIDTQWNEEHYAVALHPSSTFNALIHDRVIPG